jgi:hypothetical protein
MSTFSWATGSGSDSYLGKFSCFEEVFETDLDTLLCFFAFGGFVDLAGLATGFAFG